MTKKKNEAEERRLAFKSLPPNLKNSLTEDEADAFLNAKFWPESLFEKMSEFIVKE